MLFKILAVLAWATATARGAEPIRLVAHRGGAMEAEENTLEAFTDAYAKGLRAFETDVRMTKDGQLVLMHDDSVERTTTGFGPVELMTAQQVKALHTQRTEQAVPALADLLATLKDKPGVFLQAELKPGKGPVNEARLEQFARALTAQLAGALPSNAYCVSSFDRRALAAVRRVAPGVSLMLICNQTPDTQLLDTLRALGCDRVGVLPDKTGKPFVEAAQKAGFKVAGWSVRSDEQLALAQSLGLDSVTTDCPRRMLAKGLGRP